MANTLAGKPTFIVNDAHGRWLGATDDAVALQDNSQAGQAWTVEDYDGTACYFTSEHGKHLGSRPDQTVYVSPNRDLWEQWQIRQGNDPLVCIVSLAHGRQLGVRPDGSLYTDPNTTALEQWRADTAPSFLASAGGPSGTPPSVLTPIYIPTWLKR